MPFIDRVQIRLSSGCGGAGAVHFQSNRRSPRSGPDGGDGGKGGDLILIPQVFLSDLSHLKPGGLYKAEDGKPGRSNKRKGANGKNLSLGVPSDTICYNLQGGLLQEIQDKPWRVLCGGPGGKGNVFFKTARLQAPRISQKGTEGRQKSVILELKWKSTACLVGLRGSGKTSLLFHLSERWGKNKLYPSLKPQLFSVKTSESFASNMVLVDLPGMSSSTVRFLKQAERSKIIVFVISINDKDAFSSYQYLKKILRDYDEKYSSSLSSKRSLLILTGLQEPSFEKMRSFEDNHINYIPFFGKYTNQKKKTFIREISSIVTS